MPHHHVYVVYLRNPKRDGRAGYYVGMTGLTPDERFANHKNGIKAAGVVKRFGERLVPKLYAHLNPMTYGQALKMEQQLAEELRAAGYVGVRRPLTFATMHNAQCKMRNSRRTPRPDPQICSLRNHDKSYDVRD